MDGSVVFARLRQCDPNLMRASLDPPESTFQNGISIDSAVFCTDDRRVSPFFTMGRPFPPQNCPSHGGSGPPSNAWFLGPTRVLDPNGISVGAAVFAGLTSVIDRQTTLLGR